MNPVPFPPPKAASLVSAPGATGDRANEIDLLDLLRTIWRGKWLILFVTLIAVGMTAAYLWWVAVPLYTATAVVSLENRDEKVVDFESVVSGIGSDEASINTEVEVLRSRRLMDKLVERLDLNADPEFNGYLRPADPWSIGGVLALVLGPGEPDAEPSPRVVGDKVVKAVLKALTITNIRDSYVFQITAETRDPEKSALIADTLADLYIRDQLDVKFQQTEQATEWLSERVSQLKDELDEAENAVQEFNSQIELISPERLAVLNAQLKDFRDRYADLAAQQSSLEPQVAELEAAGESGDYARMAAVAEVPALTNLLERLAGGTEADRELFESRFEQIVERARFEAERRVAQLETMAKSIADLERQVAAQSTESLKLEQLEREAEASRLIYEYFLGRLKETSVQQGIQQPDARVLSYAMLPIEASSPRKGLLVTVSTLLGLFFGSILVLLLEMRSNSFRTAEQMEQVTGTAVIGQIPRAPYSRRQRILDYIVSKPTSAMVEAVRNLRTSILLSAADRTPQIIMMTSSMPGEGKTTLSLALAHNLAGMDKNVLVIEGDIRRRTFREFFDLQNRHGLLTAVIDEMPIEDIVYHDQKLGVDILMGERATINAADFFSSGRFAAFLERARDIYDFIVIDTPPVLMVPDARVIAQFSDAVVYVVHWDKTPRKQVTQGIQSFATVNAPVTGLVLSQIDPRGMKSYGYSGTYGQGYDAHSRKYYES